MIGLVTGGLVVLVVVVVLVFFSPFGSGSGNAGNAGDDDGDGSSDSGGDGQTAGDAAGNRQDRAAQSPARLEVAWSVPEAGSELEANTLATYVTDDAFVRASEHGVVGYDLASGEESWRVTPPKGFDRVCAASPNATEEGVAGVVFGSADDQCGLVAAVDLVAGDLLWRTQAEPGDTLVPGAAVAVSNGLLFGPYPGGTGVYGYDIAGKEAIWDQDLADQTCSVGDLAADENAVLFVVECVLAGTNELVSLDPTTGEVNWQTPLENVDPISPAEIVSVSPTVIHVGESNAQGELRVLDESGAVSTTIDAAAGGDELEFAPEITNSSTSQHHDFPIHLTDNLIVALVWVDRVDGTTPAPQVVGVDLNSGERAWTKALPAGRWVLASDPGAPRATLVRFPKGGNARTYTVDAASGSLRAGQALAEPDGGYLSEYVRFVLAGERLYQVRVNDLAYGPSVVAFGE